MFVFRWEKKGRSAGHNILFLKFKMTKYLKVYRAVLLIQYHVVSELLHRTTGIKILTLTSQSSTSNVYAYSYDLSGMQNIILQDILSCCSKCSVLWPLCICVQLLSGIMVISLHTKSSLESLFSLEVYDVNRNLC